MLSIAYRCCWQLWDVVMPPKPAQALGGRTIEVGSIADIRLRHRELVLTFDDGPIPEHTEAVLRALDDAGVKATFLMIGAQAMAYPALVRMVAERGHTIGSHTNTHLNLKELDPKSARKEIDAGRENVAAALQQQRFRAAPFFRFPFLLSTPLLRNELSGRKIVVLDADINIGDSKEFLSPQLLYRQAIRRILRRGSGVVLLHDIHARTVTILPTLLAYLKTKGFTIVHLVPQA
ncbi:MULTISPECIES: polysaccharide deacetylase family protein [unclassified Mesorhizobium]|uniref:polysaccharide deacetylase family protein n=2 Tax=Mesorhizobium TaxID=68287 RepID=UPI00142EA4D0|nr:MULTISPECIES: polysaccharide deacetylase family protein [unclassified Mesorhizobium]